MVFPTLQLDKEERKRGRVCGGEGWAQLLQLDGSFGRCEGGVCREV